jgi:hypothetical protein
MKGTNLFELGLPSSLANGFENEEDEDVLESYQNYDWDFPKLVFEESGIFSSEENLEYPQFNFEGQNLFSNELKFVDEPAKNDS